MRFSGSLTLVVVLACGTPDPVPSAVSAPPSARDPDRASASVPDPPVSVPERSPDADPPSVSSAERILALDGTQTTSLGGPTDGSLDGDLELPSSGPGFVRNPRRRHLDTGYGTVELLQALIGAAAVVESTLPGSRLIINDLSRRGGGPIAHHGSHRAGRDVDVLFYLVDDDGDPVPSVGAFLDLRGRGVDFRDLADPDDDIDVRLDVARTWRFLQALIEGPHGDAFQRIFVAEHLRTMLLAHAESTRVPAPVRERFAEITCQPAYPHDDHLHLRFFCTPEDIEAGCEDSGPIYLWRRRAVVAAGSRVRWHRPRPDRPRAEITTAEEAQAEAGPMDARVERWLVRREAWMARPHPGRPHCR